MNTCNFQVIRIAPQPIPAPPSQTKIGLLTSNVSFCLVNSATPSAGMRRDRESPHQVQFQLGSLAGATLSFSSFLPQGLQNVIISSQGAGKVSQPSQACFSSPVIQIKETLAYTTDLSGPSSCFSISETSLINPKGLSLKQ